MAIDCIELAQDLIRRPSVTPADAGAMEVLERALTSIGFRCRRMPFGNIENLYARRGDKGPNLCFAGHTDVVPAGEPAAWRHDPFAGVVSEGILHGRGAVDMKGAIAAFVSACSTTAWATDIDASISLLITGDEEGEAVNGTKRVLEALFAEGERIDHCVVGEPTSVVQVGDTVKIGRRGSLNATIVVDGVQGHVAYPERAANPIPLLLRVLNRLQSRLLDEGYSEFQPSNLEVTNIDVGNTASNVIPKMAVARLNIRFNPSHRGDDLRRWIETVCAQEGANFTGKVSAAVSISGEAFLTPRSSMTKLIEEVVQKRLGAEPSFSTSGGTSDARFIAAYAPVVELGLCGSTMHMIDEGAPTSDLVTLTEIYKGLLAAYPMMAGA